jgi:Flp pilus assembly CpaF family ATPase
LQVLVNDIVRNTQWLAYDKEAGFTVGRSADNQVVLEKSRFVSPQHLIVDRDRKKWTLTVAAGAAPATVNDVEIGPGESTELKPVSDIILPGYSLTLRQSKTDGEEEERKGGVGINQIQRDIHQNVIEQMELRHAGASNLAPDARMLLLIGNNVDQCVQNKFADQIGPDGQQRLPMLILALANRIQYWLGGGKEGGSGKYEIPGYSPVLEKLTVEYYQKISTQLGLRVGDEQLAERLMTLHADLERLVPELAAQMPENIQLYIITRYLKKVVCDMIFGLGPLQDLLEMKGVSEVMVVSPEQVYIEQNGVVVESNCTFLGNEALLSVIERIVSPLGRRIDRSNPLVDARLPDGSRVNAIIPPLALKGPCLTIRRFPEERITADHLIEWGAVSVEAMELMRGIIAGRKNVVVAGGTGSGKTTMLNVLSSFIHPEERLVTIEDSAELQLQQKHVVSLETRPANVEGKGAVTIRDLIKNALRMRPERIIVGECRGEEAFDMLQAMNTGHNGSMTTVHANSPEDVMTRLESMCLMAVDIPLEAVRQQVSQAVDAVVYLERLPNGQRMTTAIAETAGIHPKTGRIITRIIMKANFNPAAGKYQLEHNGYIPSFLPDLAAKGHLDIEKVFSAGTEE